MKIILIAAASAALSHAAVAGQGGANKLIEVPCQGDTLLVLPDPLSTPEGQAVRFVSLWGSVPPHVVTEGIYGLHTPEVVNEGKDTEGKHFAHFVLPEGETHSFTVDGCYVAWGDGQ